MNLQNLELALRFLSQSQSTNGFHVPHSAVLAAITTLCATIAAMAGWFLKISKQREDELKEKREENIKLKVENATLKQENEDLKKDNVLLLRKLREEKNKQ